LRLRHPPDATRLNSAQRPACNKFNIKQIRTSDFHKFQNGLAPVFRRRSVRPERAQTAGSLLQFVGCNVLLARDLTRVVVHTRSCRALLASIKGARRSDDPVGCSNRMLRELDQESNLPLRHHGPALPRRRLAPSTLGDSHYSYWDRFHVADSARRVGNRVSPGVAILLPPEIEAAQLCP